MDWIAAAVLATQLSTSMPGRELTVGSQTEANIAGAFAVGTPVDVNGTIGSAFSLPPYAWMERMPCSGDAAASLAPFAAKVTSAGIAGQPASSRRRKIITGALVGFGVGALLGVTVGQEMCLNHGKWLCVVEGGGMGTFFGIMIAKR